VLCRIQQLEVRGVADVRNDWVLRFQIEKNVRMWEPSRRKLHITRGHHRISLYEALCAFCRADV